MASVPKIMLAGVLASAISRVLKPFFNKASTALIIVADSSFQPNDISNNNAADKMEANGFAKPLPVISCAEP
jgi:hypothetical protein